MIISFNHPKTLDGWFDTRKTKNRKNQIWHKIFLKTFSKLSWLSNPKNKTKHTYFAVLIIGIHPFRICQTTKTSEIQINNDSKSTWKLNNIRIRSDMLIKLTLNTITFDFQDGSTTKEKKKYKEKTFRKAREMFYQTAKLNIFSLSLLSVFLDVSLFFINSKNEWTNERKLNHRIVKMLAKVVGA